MPHQKMIDAILQQKMLPLFYHDDPTVCIAIVKALYSAGIRVIEFTNRGANALQNAQQLIAERNASMPDLLISIGTITDGKQAAAFAAIGVDFLISPVYDAAIHENTQQLNIGWIPGCMTPTEIHTASSSGCTLVKLFPGNVLQPSFVAAVKDLFPHTYMMPTGGVTGNIENLQAWFNAGVCAVGMGSTLITKQIMNNKNYELLTTTTAQILQDINTITSSAITTS